MPSGVCNVKCNAMCYTRFSLRALFDIMCYCLRFGVPLRGVGRPLADALLCGARLSHRPIRPVRCRGSLLLADSRERRGRRRARGDRASQRREALRGAAPARRKPIRQVSLPEFRKLVWANRLHWCRIPTSYDLGVQLCDREGLSSRAMR